MGGLEGGRDREETSWRRDKEARHRRVRPMQMMTLGVLRRVNEECFFFPFSEKKKEQTRQCQVSYDTAMSIQPLVCASPAAFQDLDSSSSPRPPAVSNLPMC